MIDIRAGLLLALSSLAICAEAKGRGGGGGTSGSGSGLNLGLSGKEIAILVTAAVFAIVFFSQFIRSFKIFSSRPYDEEIPLRKPFGALILFATTSLTVYHALRAVTATSSSPRWTNFPKDLFVVQLAFSKFIDIFTAGVVFMMVAHRRKFFMQETCLYGTGTQRIFYIILPIVYLVVMFAMTAAMTGMYSRVLLEETFIPSASFYRTYDATAHVYLTAYLLLVITTVTSAWLLVKDIDLGLAGSYPYNHQHVFSRVAKVMCTALAIQALFALIVHIIIYLPAAQNSSYSRFALSLFELIINGFIFIVLMGTSINLGRLPKDAKAASNPDAIEAGAGSGITRIFIFKSG